MIARTLTAIAAPYGPQVATIANGFWPEVVESYLEQENARAKRMTKREWSKLYLQHWPADGRDHGGVEQR